MGEWRCDYTTEGFDKDALVPLSVPSWRLAGCGHLECTTNCEPASIPPAPLQESGESEVIKEVWNSEPVTGAGESGQSVEACNEDHCTETPRECGNCKYHCGCN